MRLTVTIAATIWILMTARGVLQPLAVAILVWLVLSAISHKLMALIPRPFRRGKTTARIISVVGIVLIILSVGIVVSENVAQLHANLPLYEENLDNWLKRAGSIFGTGEPIQVMDLLSKIDVRSVAIDLAGSTAAYVTAIFVVLIYVVFVFVEASAMPKKITAFAVTTQREARLRAVLGTVKDAIDDFLAVQVLIGALQAIPTYIILRLVGVDAPVLWAVLIFLFSFIPTIGTVFGIAVPVAMAFLQFASLGPILIVAVTLGAVQILCTNVLLPQLMSRSLNLSPLVVLFAVFAGAAVWGIVGALIAVPVLTITLIICVQEPSLRPLAVMLSADGSLPPGETPAAEEPIAETGGGG